MCNTVVNLFFEKQRTNQKECNAEDEQNGQEWLCHKFAMYPSFQVMRMVEVEGCQNAFTVKKVANVLWQEPTFMKVRTAPVP